VKFSRMIARFLVKNLFSFKELTEFNMLPGRFNRMDHHVYQTGGIGILKINAMYGANGAGKSNLIKSLSLLKQFVVTGDLPIEFLLETFKFDPESRTKDVYLGVEFIKNEIPYYYGITINQGIVVEEELAISGLGRKDDHYLFQRTDKADQKDLTVTFSPDLLIEQENAFVPRFLQNQLLQRNQPVLHYTRILGHPVFDPLLNALDWFNEDLVTIMPSYKHASLAIQLEADKAFYAFATDVMQSFDTGIQSIKIDTIPIEDFFGEDDKQQAERITAELKSNPDRVKPIITNDEEIIFVLNKKGRAFAKRLSFVHDTDGGVEKFTAAEESDGTRRLLDYLPAFYTAIKFGGVFLIDEIERSIHPLLIKELLNKFSHDKSTKGQIIFSTHESNLLDQDIFRPDEIWFAEKNMGETKVTPLSEFKEHHTIDIRKGYLNGRYGGIPFLGNLKNLNWDKYAEAN